jgi:uncharacterized membrane protein YphA (DoxX/SURF4 family)
MESLESLLKSDAGRQRLALDALRIYLGVGLFVRGALFVAKPGLVTGLLTQHGFFWPMVVAHYVAIAHLAGGLLLLVGFMTRIAALAQLPALLGAVAFVHLRDGLFSQGQGLELSALVFVMLGMVALVGAGPLSLDARLAERERREAELAGEHQARAHADPAEPRPVGVH